MFGLRMLKDKTKYREYLTEGILNAINIFSKNKMIKLELNARILQVKLSWELDKVEKGKSIGFTLEESRSLV